MITALKRYGFDDSDPLTTWINAGKDELVREFDWPFLRVTTALVTTPGVRDIQLPSTYERPGGPLTVNDISVNPLITARIPYFPENEFYGDWVSTGTDTQGYPQVYTVAPYPQTEVDQAEWQLRFWPIPDKSYVIGFRMRALVPDLVNPADTFLFLPANLHYPVVQCAAYFALMAENEEERSQTAKAEYDQAVLKGINIYGSVVSDEETVVKDSQGYYDYST